MHQQHVRTLTNNNTTKSLQSLCEGQNEQVELIVNKFHYIIKKHRLWVFQGSGRGTDKWQLNLNITHLEKQHHPEYFCHNNIPVN